MNDIILSGLNPEQIKAVETSEGPLLILAGAGSGKTKTLTHRIAYLLMTKKAQPDQILAVTFTNKAAQEMRNRIATLLGHNASNRNFMPYMGTFHGICVRLLRVDADYLQIPKNFVIFDEGDRLASVKQIMKRLYIDQKAFPAKMMANLIGSAKNEMLSPADYQSLVNSPSEAKAAKIYPLYEDLLRNNKALDFDDLINKTVRLLENNLNVRQKWQEQFRYVIIDEYQDTNTAQYKLVKLLINPKFNNIAVCGDDAQSIYGWRGADFRNILNFEADFKHATIIKLEQNYRSSGHILLAANSLINHNSKRSDKNLWTDKGNGLPVQILNCLSERDEAESIVRTLKREVNNYRQYQDFAVLYRTNAQSRIIEESLIRYNVPYRVIGGVRFYDRKEIKDILAYLRLIYQMDDQVSFRRIVNVPLRGIGNKSLINFFNFQETNNYSLSQSLEAVSSSYGLSPKAVKALSDLYNLVITFHQLASEASVSGLIESLIKKIDYFNYLDDGTPQGESRIENVKEMLSLASQYNGLNLSDFLEEVSLISDIDEPTQKDNVVTLMTLHSAKGLEFPVVFIPGLEETILPHSRSLYDNQELEEERRLCYVGITRAKEELYLLYANSRMLYGGLQTNSPSRFLSDLEQAKEVSKVISSNNYAMPAEPEVYYQPDLSLGDKVHHKIFGDGIITDIEGDMAMIDFKGKGQRKIDLSFAPIDKI